MGRSTRTYHVDRWHGADAVDIYAHVDDRWFHCKRERRRMKDVGGLAACKMRRSGQNSRLNGAKRGFSSLENSTGLLCRPVVSLPWRQMAFLLGYIFLASDSQLAWSNKKENKKKDRWIEIAINRCTHRYMLINRHKHEHSHSTEMRLNTFAWQPVIMFAQVSKFMFKTVNSPFALTPTNGGLLSPLCVCFCPGIVLRTFDVIGGNKEFRASDVVANLRLYSILLRLSR